PRLYPPSSRDRLDRHLEELDRHTAFASTRAHGVQSLVPAVHRLLVLEERDAKTLSALTVDQHQHLCALQTRWGVAGLHFIANHPDRVVDPSRVALKRRYSRVHAFSFEWSSVE